VDRLARILFDMDALDPDLARDAGRHVHQHLALADDRVFELADLVALRQVRVEVVLAVEDRAQVDLGLQPQAGAHRLLDTEFVDHRQHSRHRRIYQRDIRVRLGPEAGRGAGEQLGLAGNLGMDLQPDDDFPIALEAREGFRRGFTIGKFGHGGLLRRSGSV
jgi:hypothetical protein